MNNFSVLGDLELTLKGKSLNSNKQMFENWNVEQWATVGQIRLADQQCPSEQKCDYK